jgi:hypothetical protein
MHIREAFNVYATGGRTAPTADAAMPTGVNDVPHQFLMPLALKMRVLLILL